MYRWIDVNACGGLVVEIVPPSKARTIPVVQPRRPDLCLISFGKSDPGIEEVDFSSSFFFFFFHFCSSFTVENLCA